MHPQSTAWPPAVAEIKMFSVEQECMESFPCQHDCTVQLVDGSCHKVTMCADDIRTYLTTLKPSKIDSSKFPGLASHFSIHSSYSCNSNDSVPER